MARIFGDVILNPVDGEADGFILPWSKRQINEFLDRHKTSGAPDKTPDKSDYVEEQALKIETPAIDLSEVCAQVLREVPARSTSCDYCCATPDEKHRDWCQRPTQGFYVTALAPDQPPVKEPVLSMTHTIGTIDRCISEFLYLCEYGPIDKIDLQTLKHHADDLIGAGQKALKLIEVRP